METKTVKSNYKILQKSNFNYQSSDFFKINFLVPLLFFDKVSRAACKDA